jgi:Phage integrase family
VPEFADASLHTLRHTLASHLLNSGVPLPVVSARLGHCDVSVTARVYSHVLPDGDARAADTWEALMSPAAKAAPLKPYTPRKRPIPIRQPEPVEEFMACAGSVDQAQLGMEIVKKQVQ